MMGEDKTTVLEVTSTVVAKQKIRACKNTANFSQLHLFLLELLERDLSTLEAVKVAGCTRPANLAMKARKIYGITLPCLPVSRVRADGTIVRYGVYRLTGSDRQRLIECGFNRNQVLPQN